MERALLVFAFLLLVSGPAVVAKTGALESGVLIFCGGVMMIGFQTLVTSRDRAVDWVLIFVGALAAAAEVIRVLLSTL